MDKHKKEINFKILENSTEASPDELDFQVSRSEKERIFEMSRSKYEAKKKAAEPVETAEEVSGVEVYHRPGWYRAVSAAAVFVAIVGSVAGSAYMVNSLKANDFHPATSVEADPGDVPVGTAVEESAPLSYDMSTKEGVYNKMLNSIDFFDTVSGSYIDYTLSDVRVIDFSIDLSAVTFYDKNTTVTLYNPDDVLNGLPADTEILHEEDRANEYIFYSDGSQEYRIDGNVKDPNARVSPPLRQRDVTPMTAETIADIREWYFNYNEDEPETFDFYTNCSFYRESELGSVIGDYDAQHWAIIYLTDFDMWEITGEETILDRDCVVLEGTVRESYRQLAMWMQNFRLYVDKETGYLMKALCYDEAGQINRFLVHEDIHFDEDAEMVVLDLDAYETLEYQEPKPQNHMDVNSKGETYGSIGSRILEPDYIDVLPDLIEVGFDGGRNPGYIRTKEFLDIFVDGEEAFHMQPEVGNVSATAVAVEVNIYNEEGEFVRTHTFYTEPENLVANQTTPEENAGNAEEIDNNPEETTEDTTEAAEDMDNDTEE